MVEGLNGVVAFTVIGENFGVFTATSFPGFFPTRPTERRAGRREPWERGCFYRYRLIFSVTVNKKLKINFFCFKELNINKPVFFVSLKQNKGLRIISG